MNNAAIASKNLKKELKKAFPKIKFSSRSDTYSGGSSVYVSYKNGPKPDGVDEIAKRYQHGTFNGMEDIYEYCKTETEGSASYVTVSRKVDDETLKIAELMVRDMFKLHSDYEYTTKARQLLRNTDLTGCNIVAIDFDNEKFETQKM